jgi:Uma2 family endonuclease
MGGILQAVAEPKRKATYDDVLAAPETKVAEIIDGELILSPRPAHPHARASSVLGAELLGEFDREAGTPLRAGGWWILDEPELHLRSDVVVPDLAGWRRERAPRGDVPWFDVAPDWLCETLSPSTAGIDRGRKLGIYARACVPHLWLLDPVARTLEVLRRSDDGLYVLAAVHTGEDKARAEPFDAIELDLARLWLD